MAASKIPQDVRVANRNLSKALDFYSSIDRWDLPNRFRVQDIDPVLFDHQIIDIKQYNAWEDQHLTPQQKNDIAKLIYERFKDDTDIATQNYFFVVEHTSEGVDALAGAIGARAVRSRNPQPPIKPQGISKGSNIKGIKVNWGQATTFINERFEALQKSVGQLPKNKLAYDGPNVNYKSSTQKPLEPTKNQIEVRKYYPGTEPESSASGSASGKNKNSAGEGTPKASGQYSGELVKVPKEDEAADMLAKKLDGESRVKLKNDPNGREFDTISDQYVAQTKPPLKSLDKQFRKQAKATIEAANETDRKAYFHFEGEPDNRVLRQLNEYAARYV
ncbi:restriction endonuclease fold toxin [Paenibacillus suaedae]|nr:restriction endonuclease fold toxin [Paenibacillus sp. chi10]